MITLVANDDTQVLFSAAEARYSPYIIDAFWDEDALKQDQILDAPFATGSQLLILKVVLDAKVADGAAANFIPYNGCIQIGDLSFPAPPFVKLRWSPSLEEVLLTLSEQEIVDLLTIANDMTMWELRNGVICLMLHKIVTSQMSFKEFFEKKCSLSNIVYSIYNERLLG
jgi:hypothetical protein